MSHTEGKLNADGALIKNENGEMVAATTMIASDEGSPSAHEENARRLVACWNACDGIPIEQLEWDQPTFVKMLLERQMLKKERDELLKAFRDLYTEVMVEFGYCPDPVKFEAILSRFQAESEEKN